MSCDSGIVGFCDVWHSTKSPKQWRSAQNMDIASPCYGKPRSTDTLAIQLPSWAGTHRHHVSSIQISRVLGAPSWKSLILRSTRSQLPPVLTGIVSVPDYLPCQNASSQTTFDFCFVMIRSALVVPSQRPHEICMSCNLTWILLMPFFFFLLIFPWIFPGNLQDRLV